MSNDTLKTFEETATAISLHGLGFIQVKLGGGQRLHVWHPDLPRRDCYQHSAIHNHRFAFTSRVLVGVQRNVRVDIELVKDGTHSVISHNGPRSDKGGRLSYPVADCNVYERDPESYGPGDQYRMAIGEYHHTPVDGMVATLMTKRETGTIHANSICAKGVDFHYDFDRFQLSDTYLWGFVTEVLATA